MLVKIIIVLILTIAVGVLGFSDIGEGVFNFVDKSAAAEFAEDGRDLTQIVEIYNTDQAGTQTAFAGATVLPAVISDLTLNTLNDFLTQDTNGDFLKKPVSVADYELLIDADSAYLRFGSVAGTAISEDVCNEITEIATGVNTVVGASPVSVAFGADNTSLLAILRSAAVDVDDNEMVCVEDSGNAGTYNAFYRLGSSL